MHSQFSNLVAALKIFQLKESPRNGGNVQNKIQSTVCWLFCIHSGHIASQKQDEGNCLAKNLYIRALKERFWLWWGEHCQGLIINFVNPNQLVISLCCHYSSLLCVSQIKQFQQNESKTFQDCILFCRKIIERIWGKQKIWNKNIFFYPS